MSPTAAPQVNQSHGVSGVTALLLLLLPCTSTLLLLHCLLLLCRLLRPCRSRTPQDPLPCRSRTPQDPLPCRSRTPQDPLSCRSRTPQDPLPCRSRTPQDPLSCRSRTPEEEELLLQVVSSSPLLRPGPRPDTATGASSGALSCRVRLPGSQRSPCPIRASCCCRVTPGLDPGSSGSSETEVGLHLVPPNSPMFPDGLFLQSGSVLTDGPGRWREDRDQSCSSRSALGPGLDSDFGASAGVSLRILSSDSDGLSSAALTPGLEWDYYDPCYVRQNNVPRRPRNRPALHCKHYWV